MSAISVGRIVTKIMGREAGKKAVVTQLLDKTFVEISGPYDVTGVKRRRVNISHIEPTQFKLDLTLDDNSDDAIKGLLKQNKDAEKELKSSL